MYYIFKFEIPFPCQEVQCGICWESTDIPICILAEIYISKKWKKNTCACTLLCRMPPVCGDVSADRILTQIICNGTCNYSVGWYSHQSTMVATIMVYTEICIRLLVYDFMLCVPESLIVHTETRLPCCRIDATKHVRDYFDILRNLTPERVFIKLDIELWICNAIKYSMKHMNDINSGRLYDGRVYTIIKKISRIHYFHHNVNM